MKNYFLDARVTRHSPVCGSGRIISKSVASIPLTYKYNHRIILTVRRRKVKVTLKIKAGRGGKK